MAHIQTNFNNLLACVKLETGNHPTQREIVETIGVTESTLSRFAQGKTGRFDEELLVKLVDYFDRKLKDECTLADLMSYPPAEGQVIIEYSAIAAVR